MSTRFTWKQAFVPFGLLVLLAMSGCGKARPVMEVPAPSVTVDTAQKKEVQIYLTALGDTVSYENVEIVARVPGFLEKILFTPGKLVEKDTPLFLIEQAAYKIALDSAEAQLQLDQARESLARANLERARILYEQNKTIPVEEYETRVSEHKVALANIERSKMAVEKAQLDLSYTEIASPISGKTTERNIDVGNYVGQNGAPTQLVTVTRLDPIYVDFAISDREFNYYNKSTNFVQQLKVSRSVNPHDAHRNDAEGKPVFMQVAARLEGDTGTAKAPATETEIPVVKVLNNAISDTEEEKDFPFEVAVLGDEKNRYDYRFRGKLTSIIENEIKPQAGQIKIRGEMPNPDFALFPGQIVRVRIPVEKMPNAVLVREEAILTDLDTKYVVLVIDGEKEVAKRDSTGNAVMDADGKPVMEKVPAKIAKRQTIKIGRRIEDGMQIVTEGLNGGETYIITGLQKVRLDAPVDILTALSGEKTDAEPTVETEETATP